MTSVTPMEAQNFNYEATPDYDKRYGRAAEFVDVVRGTEVRLTVLGGHIVHRSEG